ncbi:exported hypothetical protein [Candidatus Sulfopaludibacter sp. SbA6]|nr:exported hypothetical protein [Candidatus Sulfopaludibacter sp. SbA6]
MRRKHLLILIAVLVAAGVGFWLWRTTAGTPPMRMAVSPFQDTLVPIVGETTGWYKQDGVQITFTILGWAEVMEALSGGSVDVAINNISSVIATHQRNPEIVYYYGLNPFDNGFALMVRPNGPLKTVAQIEAETGDHNRAIQLAASQLKGRTVVTTGKTDMEQGVAAAARRGGLDFQRDLKIIDMNPDEGLAAFLRGDGDAYIGGIPQRTRAEKEGMVAMLTGADLGPPPINGLVTTKRYAASHQKELLKVLHVWFRIVNYIDADMQAGAAPIIEKLNASSPAQFTLDDFKRFWNHYEHYPPNPRAVQELILDPSGRNYWKSRWDDCNQYFYNITHTIAQPVKPEDAFLMLQVQDAYIKAYGSE